MEKELDPNGFIDSNGLVNPKPGQRKCENASLYSLEYILIRKMCGKTSPEMTKNLHNFFEKCKLRDGLYDQRDFRDGSQDDYVSHDQLTAISIYSYMNGWNWHKQIWKEIKRQHGRYDNLHPNKSFNPFKKRTYTGEERWVHPRDMIYYGILNNNFLAKRAFPVFAFMMQLTCKKKKVTSGKLLAFTRVSALSHTHHNFKKLFSKITDTIRDNDTMKNWVTPFNIYFSYEKNPIHIEINSNKDTQDWLK